MEASMVDFSKLNSLADLIAKRRELADALRLIDATITEYRRARQRTEAIDKAS
jgi:hypothetical protein